MSVAIESPAATALRCAVCGSPERKRVRREPAGHELIECLRCGVWSVFPLPRPASAEILYGERYYAAWREEAGARRRMWRRRLRLLDGVRRGRLLDVGCAEGSFLIEARALGFEVEGTELSPHAARRAAAILGVPVHEGSLPDLALPRRSYAAVTLWHVLEHTEDPGANLRAARDLLAPDGHLVVAVPSRRNPIFRAAYRLVRGRPPHLYDPSDREQHVHHWDPSSLRAALEANGLVVERLSPDPCALGIGKRVIDAAGRLHSMAAGEPRTSAIVAVARLREDAA